MAVRLIRRFTDLDPAWVTTALRGSGTIRDAAVAGIAVEPVGVGAGFLGQVARLRLQYDRPEATAPTTIIGKLPTLDPGGREICRMFKFYEREIRFYRELAARVPVRVPRCHASVMDVAEDDYLLLLEDLSGAPIGDDAAGCSAADAERAVRGIARLHRAWWEHAELEGLDWMPLSNAPIHQSAEVAYQQTAEPFLHLFGDHVSAKMRAVTEHLGSHIVTQLDAFTRPPLTVAHGDYRLDNIFFDGAAVAAIDWQIAFRGRGVFDVAYFLSGCLAPAVRRTEEMRLLRLWHELAARGDTAYGFDEALLDYRRAVLYSHVYTVIATASLDPANERGTSVFRAWLERRSAAIEDLDAGDLLPA